MRVTSSEGDGSPPVDRTTASGATTTAYPNLPATAAAPHLQHPPLPARSSGAALIQAAAAAAAAAESAQRQPMLHPASSLLASTTGFNPQQQLQALMLPPHKQQLLLLQQQHLQQLQQQQQQILQQQQQAAAATQQQRRCFNPSHRVGCSCAEHFPFSGAMAQQNKADSNRKRIRDLDDDDTGAMDDSVGDRDGLEGDRDSNHRQSASDHQRVKTRIVDASGEGDDDTEEDDEAGGGDSSDEQDGEGDDSVHEYSSSGNTPSHPQQLTLPHKPAAAHRSGRGRGGGGRGSRGGGRGGGRKKGKGGDADLLQRPCPKIQGCVRPRGHRGRCKVPKFQPCSRHPYCVRQNSHVGPCKIRSPEGGGAAAAAAAATGGVPPATAGNKRPLLGGLNFGGGLGGAVHGDSNFHGDGGVGASPVAVGIHHAGGAAAAAASSSLGTLPWPRVCALCLRSCAEEPEVAVCHGCGRRFHTNCATPEGSDEDNWFCLYCCNLFAAMQIHYAPATLQYHPHIQQQIHHHQQQQDNQDQEEDQDIRPADDG